VKRREEKFFFAAMSPRCGHENRNESKFEQKLFGFVFNKIYPKHVELIITDRHRFFSFKLFSLSLFR